ncbi:glutathione S-transferase [Maritalea mediterranea]|uniref:Glutathione S-transferase n=1 Tax=Maritalea mediterranea TaxID=2909667 RepID=A0ABS9E5B0_9HYPH|nr:glutathione S-transferase [Maritalea mediterranea]MCF4098048.1 glutathione S-transferase [Maritalea mediterranea]
MSRPILYSFRRCPYAMRGRLGLHAAGIEVELREILLRDKPDLFLQRSPKGTVPVLDLGDEVIEESHDILQWALAQHDPENLQHGGQDLPQMHALIAQLDREFKPLLDRYKYPSRYELDSGEPARNDALPFLDMLDARLRDGGFLFHGRISVADLGIWPFIRQFAHVDRNWFWAQDRPHLIAWLDYFWDSARFEAIMPKFSPWQPGDEPVIFPTK